MGHAKKIRELGESNNILGIIEYIFQEAFEKEFQYKDVLELFKLKEPIRLAPDCLIFECSELFAISHVQIIHSVENPNEVKSFLILLAKGRLNLLDLQRKLGSFKVNEISRWELIYELVFSEFKNYNISNIILRTLPLEITNNIFELITKHDNHWLQSVEFEK